MGPIFKGSLGFDVAENGSFLLSFRDHTENGTDSLSQNVGKKLLFYAARNSKRTQISDMFIFSKALKHPLGPSEAEV